MSKPSKPSGKPASKPSSAPKSAKTKKALGPDDLEKVTGGYQTGGHGQPPTIGSATGGAGAGKARKAGGTQ